MTQKRLKDQIKEAKRELKQTRKRFQEVATHEGKTDLGLLDELSNKIMELTLKYEELSNRYLKKEG